MDDLREKVIKGLRCIAGENDMKRNDMKSCPCDSCGYQECQTYSICIATLARDALSLLKAQEPRVMSLKEVVSAECVWIEYAVSGNVVIAFPWNIELSDDTYNFICNPNCIVEFKSLYGEEWRCWNARPTDEQREAVKWE